MPAAMPGGGLSGGGLSGGGLSGGGLSGVPLSHAMGEPLGDTTPSERAPLSRTGKAAKKGNDYRELITRAVRHQLSSLRLDAHGLTNPRGQDRTLAGHVASQRAFLLERFPERRLFEWDPVHGIGLPEFNNEWGRLSSRDHELKCSADWLAFKRRWVDPLIAAQKPVPPQPPQPPQPTGLLPSSNALLDACTHMARDTAPNIELSAVPTSLLPSSADTIGFVEVSAIEVPHAPPLSNHSHHHLNAHAATYPAHAIHATAHDAPLAAESAPLLSACDATLVASLGTLPITPHAPLSLPMDGLSPPLGAPHMDMDAPAAEQQPLQPLQQQHMLLQQPSQPQQHQQQQPPPPQLLVTEDHNGHAACPANGAYAAAPSDDAAASHAAYAAAAHAQAAYTANGHAPLHNGPSGVACGLAYGPPYGWSGVKRARPHSPTGPAASMPRMGESPYVLDSHGHVANHMTGHAADSTGPPHVLDGVQSPYVPDGAGQPFLPDGVQPAYAPDGVQQPFVPDSHVAGATAACDGFGWEARAAQIWPP